MFSLNVRESIVADPQGDLYLISGRVPGEDDDTAKVVQAESLDLARAAFVCSLYAQEADPDAAMARSGRQYGEVAFIVSASLIGHNMAPLGSHWDEDPEFSVEDWQHEVAEDNTRLGYLAWVESQREAAAHDEASLAGGAEGSR